MSRYEDEYRKWVESLPPKQRAKLAANGIDNLSQTTTEFSRQTQA